MDEIEYIGHSCINQNADIQEIDLKESGIDRFLSAKLSGKNIDRSELKKGWNIYKGDTLYIENISRFARITKDLLNNSGIVESLVIAFDRAVFT